MMLDGIRRDLDRGQTTRSAMLVYCCLNGLYDTFLLSWSKTWRETVWYEMRCRASGIDGEFYFVGWHNRELSIVPPEEQAKLYVQVPGWRKMYEPCRALKVSTSPLFAYAARVLIEEKLG